LKEAWGGYFPQDFSKSNEKLNQNSLIQVIDLLEEIFMKQTKKLPAAARTEITQFISISYGITWKLLEFIFDFLLIFKIASKKPVLLSPLEYNHKYLLPPFLLANFIKKPHY